MYISFNNPFSHFLLLAFSSGPPLFVPHSLLIILTFLSASSILVSHPFLLSFSSSLVLFFSHSCSLLSLFFSHCLSQYALLSVSSVNFVFCHSLLCLLLFFLLLFPSIILLLVLFSASCLVSFSFLMLMGPTLFEIAGLGAHPGAPSLRPQQTDSKTQDLVLFFLAFLF